jgi:predicted nucleic acid-binding protein
LFIQLVDELRSDANTVIVPASSKLFEEGYDLFRRRADKDWSLTDCLSFVVMDQEGVSEALTADHDFEQAGFTILMK